MRVGGRSAARAADHRTQGARPTTVSTMFTSSLTEGNIGSRSGPSIAILKADGTNCEVETAHACAIFGARAEILPMNTLRQGKATLADFDALIIPGGFSYGDDVAGGQVMAIELMSRLRDQLGDFAAARKPILGICNGFQVLVRTGLLPFGAPGEAEVALAQNRSGRFECRWVRMAVEGGAGADFLEGLPTTLEMPMAHAEGRFYADPETLARIEAADLVALRYVDDHGAPTADYPDNPNGSLSAIAGIADPSGRIFGLMPHPERYTERYQHPDWRGRPDRETPDGLAFFRRLAALA